MHTEDQKDLAEIRAGELKHGFSEIAITLGINANQVRELVFPDDEPNHTVLTLEHQDSLKKLVSFRVALGHVFGEGNIKEKIQTAKTATSGQTIREALINDGQDGLKDSIYAIESILGGPIT